MVRQEMIVFFMAHGIIYNYVANIQKKSASTKAVKTLFSIFRQDLKSSDKNETFSDKIETLCLVSGFNYQVFYFQLSTAKARVSALNFQFSTMTCGQDGNKNKNRKQNANH